MRLIGQQFKSRMLSLESLKIRLQNLFKRFRNVFLHQLSSEVQSTVTSSPCVAAPVRVPTDLCHHSRCSALHFKVDIQSTSMPPFLPMGQQRQI